MISPRLSIVLACIITAVSVLAALTGLVLAFWGMALWAAQRGWDLPQQVGWAGIALLVYLASRIAFWLLTRVPIRHD